MNTTEAFRRFPAAYTQGFNARVAYAERIRKGEVVDGDDMPPEPYKEPEWPKNCYPNECHAYRIGWANAIDAE